MAKVFNSSSILGEEFFYAGDVPVVYAGGRGYFWRCARLSLPLRETNWNRVMTGKMSKTNAARLLDKAGIAYGLVAYEVDEEDLSATHVAEQLGEDVGQVFKTLVLRGDKTGIFVCVVPGDAEVDLKMAAKVSGNKSAEMLHVKELLPATGYIRGGCSPVGMKKAYPTYIHSTCLAYEFIYVSAGVRGMQLKVAPRDLVAFTRAKVADLF